MNKINSWKAASVLGVKSSKNIYNLTKLSLTINLMFKLISFSNFHIKRKLKSCLNWLHLLFLFLILLLLFCFYQLLYSIYNVSKKGISIPLSTLTLQQYSHYKLYLYAFITKMFVSLYKQNEIIFYLQNHFNPDKEKNYTNVLQIRHMFQYHSNQEKINISNVNWQ